MFPQWAANAPDTRNPTPEMTFGRKDAAPASCTIAYLHTRGRKALTAAEHNSKAPSVALANVSAMDESKAHAVAPARWRDPKSPLHQQVSDGAFATERVARWRSDLRRVANEVSGLYVHRHIYDGLGEIVAANTSLQQPNLFLAELFEWYAVTNVVQANRDAERSSDVISLANILAEIADHPDELSRRAFRKLQTGKAYIPAAVPDEAGDTPEHDDVVWLLEPVYDEFAKPLDRERLDVARVRDDLRQLKSAAELVGTFRNEVSAHRARDLSITSISMKAIHDYVDALSQLAVKYETLLFGAAPTTREPIELQDWKAIFRFPWIAPQEERRFSVPYAATVDVGVTLFRALTPEDQQTFKERLGF
jgi:hypothetical protein